MVETQPSQLSEHQTDAETLRQIYECVVHLALSSGIIWPVKDLADFCMVMHRWQADPQLLVDMEAAGAKFDCFEETIALVRRSMVREGSGLKLMSPWRS